LLKNDFSIIELNYVVLSTDGFEDLKHHFFTKEIIEARIHYNAQASFYNLISTIPKANKYIQNIIFDYKTFSFKIYLKKDFISNNIIKDNLSNFYIFENETILSYNISTTNNKIEHYIEFNQMTKLINILRVDYEFLIWELILFVSKLLIFIGKIEVLYNSNEFQACIKKGSTVLSFLGFSLCIELGSIEPRTISFSFMFNERLDNLNKTSIFPNKVLNLHMKEIFPNLNIDEKLIHNINIYIFYTAIFEKISSSSISGGYPFNSNLRETNNNQFICAKPYVFIKDSKTLHIRGKINDQPVSVYIEIESVNRVTVYSKFT